MKSLSRFSSWVGSSSTSTGRDWQKLRGYRAEGDDDDDSRARSSENSLITAESGGLDVNDIGHERKPFPVASYIVCGRRKSARLRSRRAICTLVLVLLITTLMAFIKIRENSFNQRWNPGPGPSESDLDALEWAWERNSIGSYKLPLRTNGSRIVDERCRRFRLLSVNWYGASDELFVPGGLEVQHRSVIAQTIRRLGFNSVRLPYADEMVVKNPKIDDALLSANPDLAGMRALDVFEAVVNALTSEGIAVIVNNHITSATWCCGADPCDAAWENDYLGVLCRVRQTEEGWMDNWETVMRRFVDNPLVIGADLRNEVRGLWGTMPWATWAAAAERCGNRLLKMNRDWLIVVEGNESANDLSGAAGRPVKLDAPDRLVYSAHVYKWSGWGSAAEGRFLQRGYASFSRAMRRNWAYLVEGGVAPVWVGEVGAPRLPSRGDGRYWRHLWAFLREVDVDGDVDGAAGDFGYWALNPRKPHGNSSETYGLVGDDWMTPVLDYRMGDMMKAMRAAGTARESKIGDGNGV